MREFVIAFVAMFAGFCAGASFVWWLVREAIYDSSVFRSMRVRLDVLERMGEPMPVFGEKCPHGDDWDDCPECRR